MIRLTRTFCVFCSLALATVAADGRAESSPAKAYGAPPKIIGKGDALLRQYVAARASKDPNKNVHELRRRMEAAPKKEWVPTLCGALEHPPGPLSTPDAAARSRSQDADFWSFTAAAVLGALRAPEGAECVLGYLLAGGRGGAPMDDALISIGAPAVERAGRLLLDSNDSLRKRQRYDGKLPDERTVLQVVTRVLAASGSASVREALLAYGQRTNDRGSIASVLVSLPKSDAAVAFYKQTFLDSLAGLTSRPWSGVTGWGDPTLAAWLYKQAVSYRVDGSALIATARDMALLGDSNAIQSSLSVVKTHGGAEQLEEFQAYLGLTQQCQNKTGCYATTLKEEIKTPSKATLYRLNKALAMVVRSGDKTAAEAMLGDEKLSSVLWQNPAVDNLLGLVSSDFASKLDPKLPLSRKARLQPRWPGSANRGRPCSPPAAPPRDLTCSST